MEIEDFTQYIRECSKQRVSYGVVEWVKQMINFDEKLLMSNQWKVY